MLALLALFSVAATPAHAYDKLFGSGFDNVTDAPVSVAEATRFLTMATSAAR
jgi:hypothetical protein